MIVAAINWGITIPILIALVAGVFVGHLMRQARTKSKKARAERDALAKRAAKKQGEPAAEVVAGQAVPGGEPAAEAHRVGKLRRCEELAHQVAAAGQGSQAASGGGSGPGGASAGGPASGGPPAGA